MKLEIQHLTKHYWLERESTDVLALHDVSLGVADGEFFALVGPAAAARLHC